MMCDIERYVYNYESFGHFAERHWWLPLTALKAYVLLLCAATWQRRRANRVGHVGRVTMAGVLAPPTLAPVCAPWLAAWNAALAALSAIGVAFTAPLLLQEVARGLPHAVCATAVETYACGNAGAAVGCFTMSKIVELGDTVWLVARRRRVRFLHWYHHATVLLYSWLALARHTGVLGLWFATVNMAIHALMYAYYARCACGPALWLRHWAPVLTCLQIAQMAVGATLVAAAGTYLLQGAPCAVAPSVAATGAVVYVSYGVLFVAFYRSAYGRPARSHSANRGHKIHMEQNTEHSREYKDNNNVGKHE